MPLSASAPLRASGAVRVAWSPLCHPFRDGIAAPPDPFPNGRTGLPSGPGRAAEFLDSTGRRWWWHLEIAFVLCALFGLYGKYDYQQLNTLAQKMTHRELIWARLIYMSIYSCMMWAFILGFIGFFTRFFQRSSVWIRYMVDSSYWIYLIHFPVVVSLQVLASSVAVPWPLKYTAINAVAFLLLFMSYHYFVRNTFIGVQLNGRRYPMTWPWLAD